MATCSSQVPSKGYGTEYNENFTWSKEKTKASSWNKESSGLFKPCLPQAEASMSIPATHVQQRSNLDPSQFHSDLYPSVYREVQVPMNESDNYHDSFRTIARKPYGRRLMYDTTHPHKMYGSQWSSELADPPGPYSFPTTTGLPPEIPFNRNLQWQMEGEVGRWPTELWKQWRSVAMSPPYDGHDDQLEYSKYKVQVP